MIRRAIHHYIQRTNVDRKNAAHTQERNAKKKKDSSIAYTRAHTVVILYRDWRLENISQEVAKGTLKRKYRSTIVNFAEVQYARLKKVL
jgi:hypothetical protein